MKHNDARKLARYIMTTGRLIQNRIISLHNPHFGSGKSKQALKELSLSQIQTIMTVYGSGQISMTTLSKQMGVSPPSSSAMVDRLVEKGILIREHSRIDRRKVMVQIAPSLKTDIQTIEEAILIPIFTRRKAFRVKKKSAFSASGSNDIAVLVSEPS